MEDARTVVLCLIVAFQLCATSPRNGTNPRWTVEFSPIVPKITMANNFTESVTIIGHNAVISGHHFHVRTENPYIAFIGHETLSLSKIDNTSETGMERWSASFNITGNFLGKTKVYIEIIDANDASEQYPSYKDVIVIRPNRIIDAVFIYSVIVFVAVMFVLFGASLDFATIKEILMRPIGPIIGFCTQFGFMPLISYCIGWAIFPNNPALHLGLFFTGISPGGGASNTWSVILGGNINLSIVMTSISTLVALGMIPFWTFTLGQVIFDKANLEVPYVKIVRSVAGMLIPLVVGIGIQKFFPRMTKILIRLVKPLSSLLVLFIVIFAIITNLYLFELFSWPVILAGSGLPWLGYGFSWTMAKLMMQTPPDVLAIAIEGGVKNTGISIFLLLSLPQPEGDLTTVIPVAVAIMTPIPLFAFYIYKKLQKKPEIKHEGEEAHSMVAHNLE